MASSTSLKALSKALSSFLADPFLPLPNSLLDTITAFTERQEEYDDAAADRLQDELQSIFEKRVEGNEKATGAWIAVLRRLLPVLQTPQRVLPWFDACKGLLDSDGLDKNTVDETVASLMDLVTLIDEYQVDYEGDSPAMRIINRMFQVWMSRFYPALLDGNIYSEYNERLIRQALCDFGKKRPKEFFATIDMYFIQKAYRKSALRFLCDFIRVQPPHLHQILQTSMFANLLTCLQQDTSTTVVSAALTTIIMLLPHMPSSLVPHLPTLFNIYARLLFWGQEISHAPAHADDEDTTAPAAWETSSFDPDVDDQAIPHLSNYYTILYGLYPLNFMDYIRKPQRYLRHANAPSTDDIDVQPTELRHRSETFRRNHLLHPNFYSLTVESEKTDFSRWIKSEAAEVVADCMGLCTETGLYNFADLSVAVPGGVGSRADTDAGDMEANKADVALLSGSAGHTEGWRNSQQTDSASSNQTPATMMRRSSQSSSAGLGRTAGTDSPTLTLSASHTQLQDLIQSNKAIKSGLHQSLGNDSVPSLLSNQESGQGPAQAPAALSSAPPLIPGMAASPLSLSNSANTQVAHLQKQILLLQNDLSFERYLKQQHMAHIGDLRRRQMAEAASEAETQNLILTNRNLRSRFEESKKAEMQTKKESEKSRAMAKKWEADLANKLKNLREESKKTHSDLEAVQRELDESRQECHKLRQLVCAAEVKELTWRQNAQSAEVASADADRLKNEITRLTKAERDYQSRDLQRQAAVDSASQAESEVEAFRMKISSLEHDTQRAQSMFQSQVAALQAQLSDTQEERERAPSASANLAVESALAASRAKQAELQKQYGLLNRKYTALQSSLLDMQSEQEQSQQRAPPIVQPSLPQTDNLSMSTSPVLVKSRSHRAPSNTTTGSSPTGLRQVTSQEASSPDQRPFGALHSRLRRDSRDKGRDDSSTGSSKPKKEKKSSGLRGIRGFV